MNPEFERHLALGNHFFVALSYERAAREFEAALGLEPDDNDARLLLARCYLNLDRLEDAHFAAEIALQNDPDNADAHYMKACAARTHGEEVEAIHAALQLDPENAAYHIHRSHLWTREGKYALALESARRALEIAPNSASAHCHIAHVLFAEAEARNGWSRAKYQTVAFHAARALEIEPDSAQSQLVLARLRDCEYDRGESVEQWEEVLRLDPNATYAQYRHRQARRDAKLARFPVFLWRILFRWMPWPLRLPLLWGLVVYWARDPLLFLLSFIFSALMTPLLLRDWLQWVPDRFLFGLLYSMKQPPLR